MDKSIYTREYGVFLRHLREARELQMQISTLVIIFLPHGKRPPNREEFSLLRRAFYQDSLDDFFRRNGDEILGQLVAASPYSIDTTQRDAWAEQISILKESLKSHRAHGKLYFEFSIPRVGRRIDAVLIIQHVLFIIEFKVGEREFSASAIDQVCDYALDLKNFHQSTHDKSVAPILIATRAEPIETAIATTPQNDGILFPVCTTPAGLQTVIKGVLDFCEGPSIDIPHWEEGRYSPTPTIIEAAMALYGGHDVSDISRSDASAINLSRTSESISTIIETARAARHKSICFVTGVPGAGKTLVGLNIATQHIDNSSECYSVFLSGNGPLVSILREALARDKVRRKKEAGERFKKETARSEVKSFIQNVHHFRDECLVDRTRPPIEHVALFDEAQRAWNLKQTAAFMLRKKNHPDFAKSEPEFLISCMDRHLDWAVIVCLVGGGQETNTGEAGIGEWIHSILRAYPDWHVYISPNIHDSEYGAGQALELLKGRRNVHLNVDLHLGVSMRSFRAEHVSAFVKKVLDREVVEARRILEEIKDRYPIVLTRDLRKAKLWLREQARGSERYGMVVSSQALRLKPHAIDIRSPVNPIHWFLHGKEDVRSSYYLEDVATEFHVQGLELDWACVVWDADFRYSKDAWKHLSFTGDSWKRLLKPERQTYLKNAYRVLLTRARQGMVIVVPPGDVADITRHPSFYDPTHDYLRSIGIQEI